MAGKTLIVGAGLAGTLVAWELIKRDLEFTVYDNGSPSASRVAAGMYNPVSFKRIVEVDDAEERMELMHATYSEIESELGIKILNRAPIMRIFPNAQYREHWVNRIAKGHPVAKWLRPVENEVPDGVEAPWGVGKVSESGWVNIPLLTSAMNERLKSEGCFEFKSWSIQDGLPEGFDRVIDCRGVGAKPELNILGLRLAADHGEILTLKSTLDLQGSTLNKVKWLMPFEKDTFKLGATYEWGVEKSQPTKSGKEELLTAITSALSKEVYDALEITNHESGHRPTSHDRKPYTGEVVPKVYVINGLGTRGVLIAPKVVRNAIDELFSV